MGFYEDATPEQQQLLSIGENRLRQILAASPSDCWQVLVDLLGPEAVLGWAKELAKAEKLTLEAVVAEAQERVDAVAEVVASSEESPPEGS